MDKTTVFVKGKVYWPKIVGDGALHDNYDGDAREWSYELEPYDTTFLKDNGLLDRLKDKEDAKNPDKGKFLVLRKPELNKEGEKNDPIRIYDSDNQAWDEDTLIGNGTEVVAKLTIVKWGRGKKSSIWTTAIRVEDLVPYQSDEFSAFDGEGEDAPKPKKKAPAKKKTETEDLDDDIPF